MGYKIILLKKIKDSFFKAEGLEEIVTVYKALPYRYILSDTSHGYFVFTPHGEQVKVSKEIYSAYSDIFDLVAIKGDNRVYKWLEE